MADHNPQTMGKTRVSWDRRLWFSVVQQFDVFRKHSSGLAFRIV